MTGRLARGLPGGRGLVLVDVLLVIWTATWIGMGMSVASQVEGLTGTTYTISNVGGAIGQVGSALASLGGIPLVGDRLGQPAAKIESSGRSAVASGRKSRESIHKLSGLLGFAVALIPTVPLLAIYVPLRVARLRERSALARAAGAAGEDPEFARFLARRALYTLPYNELQRLGIGAAAVTGRAVDDRLARAELRRLGVRKPRPSTR